MSYLKLVLSLAIGTLYPLTAAYQSIAQANAANSTPDPKPFDPTSVKPALAGGSRVSIEASPSLPPAIAVTDFALPESASFDQFEVLFSPFSRVFSAARLHSESTHTESTHTESTHTESTHFTPEREVLTSIVPERSANSIAFSQATGDRDQAQAASHPSASHPSASHHSHPASNYQAAFDVTQYDWGKIVAQSAGVSPNSLVSTPTTATTSRLPSTTSSAQEIATKTTAAPSGTKSQQSSPQSQPQRLAQTQRITPSPQRHQQLAQASPVPAAAVSAGTAAAPVDSSYTLGAGDRLIINIFNVPEYSGEQQVLADGSLNLPAIGAVPVAGLSIKDAEALISRRYSSELRYPRITISLQQPRPLSVAISGEVRSPGLYTLTLTEEAQFPSVAQAIQAAGGVTQAANLRQVELRRTGANGMTQTIALNLWDLIRHGDLRQNLALRDGDTLMIPASSTINLAETIQLADSNLAAPTDQIIDVAIVGEVFRPGTYKLGSEELPADNSTNPTTRSLFTPQPSPQPTLTQAIQQAGGITPTANIQQIQVKRSTRTGTEQLISINLWQLYQSGDRTQDLILQQGDTIVIPKATALTPAELTQLTSTNISPNAIRVTVTGEVKQPGTLEVPATTTLNQVLLAAGGLTDRSSKKVELIRLYPNGSLMRQEIRVDLNQSNRISEQNPMLWTNDVIVVDRTGAAQFGDRILEPLLRILPPFSIFF